MDLYFADYIKDYGVEYSWLDVAGIMKAVDFAVVNLETSVSHRGTTKKPEGYGFRSDPYTLEGLVNGGIDLVSTANNHILDYGRDAFLDTLENLDEYGILQSGSGLNLDEAGQEEPGPARLGQDNKDRVLDLVRIYNSKCDILVFMVHWGVEYSDKPEEWQKSYARQLVDAGVDTLIGHHPHVLQGESFES